MSAFNFLYHSPPSTAPCYTLGAAEAAGRSNIGAMEALPAVDAYMDDASEGNESVGHRRLLLYPPLDAIGVGSVSATTGHHETNSLWVATESTVRPASPEFVAWPPPGFVPYQATPRRSHRWSFSIRGASFSSATVTVHNGINLVPVRFEPGSASGAGDAALVWVVTDTYLGAPPIDTSYTVHINDVLIAGATRAFVYQVTVFTPSNQGATSITPTDLQFDPQQVNTTSPVKTVVLTNVGTAALTVQFSGVINLGSIGGFRAVGTCRPGLLIPPNGNCMIDISFTPTTSGPQRHILRFFTSDLEAAGYDIELTGQGVLQ